MRYRLPKIVMGNFYGATMITDNVVAGYGQHPHAVQHVAFVTQTAFALFVWVWSITELGMPCPLNWCRKRRMHGHDGRAIVAFNTESLVGWVGAEG